MNITIEDHPTAAIHPFTGEPLEKDGQQIPAFADHKCIKLDGAIIGYILPDETVSFIVPRSRLGEAVIKEVMEAVDFGKQGDSTTNFVTDKVAE